MMVNLICRLFGHKRLGVGWWGDGLYASVEPVGVDNLGTVHAVAHERCERCGKRVNLARFHVNTAALMSLIEIGEARRKEFRDRREEEQLIRADEPERAPFKSTRTDAGPDPKGTLVHVYGRVDCPDKVLHTTTERFPEVFDNDIYIRLAELVTCASDDAYIANETLGTLPKDVATLPARIAYLLHAGQYHDGANCYAEQGRPGEECKVCTGQHAAWLDLVEDITITLDKAGFEVKP